MTVRGLPDSRRRSYSWPQVTCSYWNRWIFILIYYNFVHFRCPWWRWANFDKCKYCGQRKGMFLLIWLFHIKFFSANRSLWSQPTNRNPIGFMFVGINMFCMCLKVIIAKLLGKGSIEFWEGPQHIYNQELKLCYYKSLSLWRALRK